MYDWWTLKAILAILWRSPIHRQLLSELIHYIDCGEDWDSL